MNRPAPLTPAGCDLRSHTYFPLHYDRLLRSKWWRRASDLARSRNVDLWAHAFREVPAASLPDDDAELADMAGFGRDLAAFLKAKAEIMEPWVLCSDGRHYHPTLSEVASDLWDRMDTKRRANRERQNARRERIKAASVTPECGPVTRDTPHLSRVTGPPTLPAVTLETASVTPISGPKERKGDLGSYEPVASAAPSATSPSSIPWKSDVEFLGVWDGATAQMRRRAKSMTKVWAEWVKVRKTTEPETVLTGLRNYLRDDPDVQRTGGPGLHLWLRDRTFEQWSVAADPTVSWKPEQWSAALGIWHESGRWGESLGPKPGEPGCRAPSHLLFKVAQ
jgi:hypothetical protein